MTPGDESRDVGEKLALLERLLETAAGIVGELSAQASPLLVRLGAVFARMPAADREPILALLEREVEFRHVAQETTDVTGFAVVRPDPNARLYLRTFDRTPRLPDLPRNDMARAILRSLRVVGRLLSPGLRPEWEAAMLYAARRLSPEERASLAAVFASALALLSHADEEPQTAGGARA
jgi:hypothetical protein